MTAQAARRYGDYTAAEALQHARRLLTMEGYERGWYALSTKVFLRLDEVDLDPADEGALHWALHRLAREAAAKDFQPMKEPYQQDPGYGFEFDSAHLGRRVYFKFRLIGSRPRLEVCSLHRPDRLLRVEGKKRN